MATDYNAGFQAAIAAMKCRVVDGCGETVELPEPDETAEIAGTVAPVGTDLPALEL